MKRKLIDNLAGQNIHLYAKVPSPQKISPKFIYKINCIDLKNGDINWSSRGT